jgi:hypothetical protein
MLGRGRTVILAVFGVCAAVAVAVAAAVATDDAAELGGGVEHPYAYPVLTQDDLAGSPAANIERLRIPDDVLDGMSSADLAWAVLDFPYLGNVYASSQIDGGTDFLRDQCDALDALLERDDAVEALQSVRAAFVAADGETTEQWGGLKLDTLDLVIATF